MENNNVSKVTGFVSMALGIVSIAMLFLPLISVDIFIASLGGNIIDIFSIQPSIGYIFVAIAVVALIGAILTAIINKVTKIIGCVFSTLSFIAAVVMIIIIFSNGSGLGKPGIGLWIMAVLLLATAVLSIVSAAKFKKIIGIVDGEPPVDGNTGMINFFGGSCAGYQIPIPQGVEIFIGKDPAQCQVVIGKEYGKVSRKHCGVMYDAESNVYLVTDYSSNGTYIVGGPRLQSNQISYLQAGTTLNLAKTDNTFQLG